MLLFKDCGVIELGIRTLFDWSRRPQQHSIECFGHVDLSSIADKGLRDQNIQSKKVLILCHNLNNSTTIGVGTRVVK